MGHEQPASHTMPHIDTVFMGMDRDGDGVVSREEFFTYCYNTNTVRQSMDFLP